MSTLKAGAPVGRKPASWDVGAWMLLASAMERLSSARSLDEILAIVRDAARRMTAADGVCCILREGVQCHYAEEDAIGPLWRGRRFPMTACISGWCMLNGRTAVVPDIYEDDRIPHDAYRPTFVRSLVMVPVGLDEPVAAIGVYWARARAPDDAVVTVLEALARSTATALAGVERELVLTRRMDELGALYRLTDRLYRSATRADSYEAALDAIVQALGCSRASILLFDDAGVMQFVAWRGLSERYRTALAGHSPWQAGDRDPQPIFVADIDDTDEPGAVKALIREEGIRALAFIPLVEKGAVIGKFMAYHDLPHFFDEHETGVAVAISRQLGFYLERSRAEEAHLVAREKLRRIDERLLLAARTGKVGLWEWDVGSGRVSWTDAIYAIHGVDRETFDGTIDAFSRLVHADDRERVGEAIRRALEEDAPYELEFRAVRPDGEIVWLFTNAFVLRDGGKPACVVGATCDITERKRAEAGLRESEERFRLMSEQAPVMIWMSDAQGGCLHLNRALREFWNVDEADTRSFQWQSSMHPEDAPGIIRQIGEALARRAPVTVEGRYTNSSGQYRVLETTARPRFSDEGEFLGMIGVNVDISERKEAEEQRELLLAELNHRVKNTLAIVQGLASQTFRNADDFAHAQQAFSARLGALAAANNLLTQSSWESTALEPLIEDVFRAMGIAKERVRLSGARLLLPSKATMAVSLILHELATNALKYGALSTGEGTVAIDWQRMDHPSGRLALEWRETKGPPISPPARRGFGSRLIERMVTSDLGGHVTMDFCADGLVCRLEMQLGGS